MRTGMTAVLTAIVSVALFASTTYAGGGGGKGEKKKAGEKIELKDLPTAVTEAAKKRAPDFKFTAAEKLSTKKQGTVYALVGSNGKQSMKLMITSTGEVVRATEMTPRKGKPK